MLSATTFINTSLGPRFLQMPQRTLYHITQLAGFLTPSPHLNSTCQPSLDGVSPCLLLSAAVMLTGRVLCPVSKGTFKPLWKPFSLWACLTLLESTFHNNRMKPTLGPLWVIFNFRKPQPCTSFPVAPLTPPLPCPVLSGLFLAWYLTGFWGWKRSTKFWQVRSLLRHFGSILLLTPAMELQALLSFLGNQSFIVKTYLNPRRALKHPFHFPVCFNGYFMWIVNLGNIKGKN